MSIFEQSALVLIGFQTCVIVVLAVLYRSAMNMLTDANQRATASQNQFIAYLENEKNMYQTIVRHDYKNFTTPDLSGIRSDD